MPFAKMTDPPMVPPGQRTRARPSTNRVAVSDQARSPVSVVVPTQFAWPAIKPFLDAIHPQLVATRAELVIVDGTVDSSALDRHHACSTLPSEQVRIVRSPGSDVFRMRAEGLVAANGQIVAITEDHCVPDPQYLASVLRAHEQYPEPAVAGAVINGTTRRLVDRVNFLLVHARNQPPRDSLPAPGWVPTPTNISYKRGAIPTDVPSRGWIETVHNVVLLHANQVVFDDRIVVRHFQSLGWLGTVKHHFHAGRSMGGLARSAIGSRCAQARWALRSTPLLPAYLVRPIWQVQRTSTGRRAVLPLLPIAAAISAADAVGFACGVLAGPGRSARAVG